MATKSSIDFAIRARQVVKVVPEKLQTNLYSFGHRENQKKGYIENAYYNGLGRYVCQLQRLTLKFSKSSGSGKGLRDYIQEDIVNYTRANPSVAVYLKPRVKYAPVLIAEYCNGIQHWQSLKDMTREEIGGWLDYYTSRSGIELQLYIKPHKSAWPTVQGVWTPFLNLPSQMATSTFPNAERAFIKKPLPSATEQLLKMIEEGKIKSAVISEHPPTGETK